MWKISDWPDILPRRPAQVGQITFHRKKNLQYFEISAKSNYNFEKPFLWLARKLTGSATLEFVARYAEIPLCDILPADKGFSHTVQVCLSVSQSGQATLISLYTALAPPELTVDAATMEQYQKELCV